MELTTQYITNNLGETVSVILPIEQFETLIKFVESMSYDFEIPQWHKDILDKRERDSKTKKLNNYNQILDEIISKI